jgi:hypothetical protein
MTGCSNAFHTADNQTCREPDPFLLMLPSSSFTLAQCATGFRHIMIEFVVRYWLDALGAVSFSTVDMDQRLLLQWTLFAQMITHGIGG